MLIFMHARQISLKRLTRASLIPSRVNKVNPICMITFCMAKSAVKNTTCLGEPSLISIGCRFFGSAVAASLP